MKNLRELKLMIQLIDQEVMHNGWLARKKQEKLPLL